MKRFMKRDVFKKICQIVIVIVLTLAVSRSNIIKLSTSNRQESDVKYNANQKITETKNIAINVEKEPNELELFIEQNEEQIRFFAKMFGMEYESVVNKIKEYNNDASNINENNIGNLKDLEGNTYNYSSIDRGILEFFLNLEETHPDMTTENTEIYDGSSEYIEALVEYFSSLYPEVDHKLMLSIAAAESGYYTSKTMIAKNNIYGGMGYNGLISYNNIEYGVMSYIKKMADSYYSKGLNTIESIGYVFCPKYENGTKIVSSHWINLVNKALEKYTYELRYVTVAQLNDLNNNEINEI